jgi:head-tail adaptor
MSCGKMRETITIRSSSFGKDAEGFAVQDGEALASVRAYKEERHGSEKWAGLAAFSTATCLFCFRAIPGLAITTAHSIECGGKSYRIVSAEDVRGMYVEALCEILEGTVR